MLATVFLAVRVWANGKADVGWVGSVYDLDVSTVEGTGDLELRLQDGWCCCCGARIGYRKSGFSTYDSIGA
jgi:hypothetical protein